MDHVELIQPQYKCDTVNLPTQNKKQTYKIYNPYEMKEITTIHYEARNPKSAIRKYLINNIGSRSFPYIGIYSFIPHKFYVYNIEKYLNEHNMIKQKDMKNDDIDILRVYVVKLPEQPLNVLNFEKLEELRKMVDHAIKTFIDEESNISSDGSDYEIQSTLSNIHSMKYYKQIEPIRFKSSRMKNNNSYEKEVKNFVLPKI